MIQPKEAALGSKIFVVSGRDGKSRRSLVRILQGFGVEVVDWEGAARQAGQTYPHAMTCVKAGFARAEAAVVLLTGDDEARLRSDVLRDEVEHLWEAALLPQPRPNVLLEWGMAWALFPTRTVVVQVGRLRPFSDFAGYQYVPLDESPETHRALANRLTLAGCRITWRPADPAALAGIPASEAGLPPAPVESSRTGIALLRRLGGVFGGIFAGFDGETEAVHRARIGERIVLSIRMPKDAQTLDVVHWAPGSAIPRPVSFAQARRTALTAEIDLAMPGPAGIHHFDLHDAGARAADGVLERCTFVAEEA